MANEKTLLDYVKKVSPGTPLRTALDDIQRSSSLGAIIVFDSPELQKIIEGGFRVNCRFSSQRLFELSKMDGAIIISPDLKRIIAANVVLTPDNTLSSNETGTRHKAAERTAKQANTFVITISERRKKTTLYFSNSKYILKTLEELIRDISSNLQILEKQREIFNELISNLNILEISGLVSVLDVCKLTQRAELITRISESIKRNFTELGKEGNIMQIRYRELIKGVEREEDKIIRDYSAFSLKKTKSLLSNLSFDGILELETIARLFIEKSLDETISPRGYRFLSHIPSINDKEISLIVRKFSNLTKIFNSQSNEFEEILKARASKIKEEIENLRTQILEGKMIS